MPRRKQSNPQPVKLEAEDGVVVGDQENLVLESDFLLGQELGFGENDYRIVGFERDSDSVTADVGMPMYGFSDEDCSTYNHLGMESDFEDPRDTESEREEIGSYLSCRQCGQLLGDPLSGALDLAGLYCLQCGAEGGDADRQDKPQEDAHPTDNAQGKTNRSRPNGNAGKTYSCKLCSFTSRYSNHLKRHMKTHNGEKPYQCQHCTYASAQLVNLQRHVRTHTGEKPYKCEFCTFACNSLGNLKRHQRMHTQEKTLDCDQCDFHASSSHSLKKHTMSHKEEKPTEEGISNWKVVPGPKGKSIQECGSWRNPDKIFITQRAPMGLHNSHPKLYPGDILEFPGNKYFSHFGIYYGERDGVSYVAHLTTRDSDTKLLLFGRALNSAVKLDPIDMVGKKYKVRNYLDDKHPPRDFYSHIKPEIEDVMTKPITFDILFNNSEHQATMLRYGVKKSEQIEKVYSKIVPTWKELFEKKMV